ncbi:MAG: hypothetical protein MUE96_12180 [Bacteroidia bacterium]|nr:hypothetical protein [Bacteroidia bacterium]
MDSALFYVNTALNIEKGNADLYMIEQITFEKIFDFNANQLSLTEQDMNNLFDQMIAFVNAKLQSLENNQDRGVVAIYLNKLPLNEFSTEMRLVGNVLFGNKTLNQQLLNFYKAGGEPFQPYENYRFNFNGGGCNQQPYYSETDFGGSRVGQFDDVHGVTRGYTTGGAKELEQRFNSNYIALKTPNGKNVLPYQPLGRKYIWQNIRQIIPSKPGNDQGRVFPWDVPIPTATSYTYQSSRHNPTRIFSNWSLAIHGTMVCLNGGMLNYYNNQAVGVLDNVLSSNTLTGRFFTMNIHSSRLSLPPAGVTDIEQQMSLNQKNSLGIKDPYFWGSNGVRYFEYFRHLYLPLQGNLVVVNDPSSGAY